MQKTIYRKWYNHEERTDCFLLIDPSGLMLEIDIHNDFDYGEMINIYQSNFKSRIDQNILIKYKEKCTKAEFEAAKKKAIAMLKGDTMNLLIYEKNKR